MLRFLLLADALPPSAETSLITAIATGAAILIVELMRRFKKDQSEAERQRAEDRLTMISNLAYAAYVITAEVARKTPGTVDDKAAFALDVLHKALASRGAAPLTPEEHVRTELAWRTRHSEENLLHLPPGTSSGTYGQGSYAPLRAPLPP